MTRLTSRLAAAGVLATGLILATTLANALPASASPTRIAAPAVPAKAAPAAAARISLRPLPGQRVGASPDIEEASCTSSRSHWVHIDTSRGLLCFGYTGTASWSVPPELYTFCSGNNDGIFETYDEATGKYAVGSFDGLRRDYPNLILIVYLEITGWSGNGSC